MLVSTGLEKLAKKIQQDAEAQENKQKSPRRSTFFDEVELALTEHMARKVKINDKNGRGTLVIEYFSEEDLSEIANLLDKH